MVAESLCEKDIRLDAVDDRTQGLAKVSITGYDLILLDGMLPGIDGIKALRQFCAAHCFSLVAGWPVPDEISKTAVWKATLAA